MGFHSQSKVCFFSVNTKLTLKNREGLKKFIELISRKEGKKIKTLNYIFCTDNYLLQINKDYLNHDFFTDTITFDLSNDPSGIIGEIYISLDRVSDNASQFGTTLQAELHRVIFHGVLHLCGYKDKRKKEKEKMRKQEDFYLKKYFS